MPDPSPTALVTGAARRLGAAMVRRLAAEGFRVALHCNASREEGDALAAEIRAEGGVCEVLVGDLAQRATVERVWDSAVDRLGPLSLVVNNASLFRNDDLIGAEEADIDAHMAVNLKAPLWLMARMAEQRDLPPGALVVNMLDNKCFALNPDFFTYTLSKAALLTATEMGAMRFAGRPRICGIAPSITLISGKQSQENFEKSARINPLHRRVTPGDICDALMLLWQDRALNGQVLVLDGGQVHWRLDRDVAFLVKEGLADG
jgi:NAD(P)-dependent dehydrogenase (short-subunit alcohol dehydrogenase family)